MASLFKQLTENEEVSELERILKKQPGCARFMGQVVDDIMDKKVEAKVFVEMAEFYHSHISGVYSLSFRGG